MTATHQSELILGGTRSGKSRRALCLGRQSSGRVAFLATARALDAGMAARIARHRAERPPSWTTVEEPIDLVPACRRLAAHHDLVVVDCLTLWIANRLERGDSDGAILSAADELALFITGRAVSLILVSNEVGAGVHPPTEIGWRFSELLGSVNQQVAAETDRVTLMVAGIPLAIKDVSLPLEGPLAHGRPPEAP